MRGKKYFNGFSFTIVELIITIAIIAVLAVTAFVLISKRIGKSRNSKRYSDVNIISKALEVNFIENNRYPNFIIMCLPKI